MNLSGKKTPILAVLLIAAAGGFGYFSALSTQTNEIQFYNINEDFPLDSGYDGYDARDDYEAFSDTAEIGDYKVHTDFQSSSEACETHVEIEENGEKIDDFTVIDAHSLADYAEDQNLGEHTYGDLTVEFGHPTYMDAYVWDGIIWDTHCAGSFNRYDYNIDWSKISFEPRIEERSEQEEIAVGFLTENDWETLQLEADVEICAGDGFCAEEKVEETFGKGESLKTVEFGYVEDYEVDIEGELFLDLEVFEASGVETIEGHVKDIDSISIASISADSENVEVSEFVFEDEKPPEGEGVEQEMPQDEEELDSSEGSSVIDVIAEFLESIFFFF